MSEDVETVPLKGRRVTWNGVNADELAALAGKRFAGVWDTDALVRLGDGLVHAVRPGWSLVLLEGVPEEHALRVLSAGADQVWLRKAT